MASSASGQDEPNRALWLATRAGKMEPSCRSGLPAVSCKQNFSKSHTINPLLTKFVRSRWLDIGFVLFLRVYGPRLHTKKELGQYPVILTSHLVNNPYILSSVSWKMAIAHQRARAPHFFFPVIVMTLSQALRKKRLIWFLLLKIE